MIAPGSATNFENSLLAAIAAGIAADPTLASNYVVTGVTSRGGTIGTQTAGSEGSGGSGSGLKTPTTKSSATRTFAIGATTTTLLLCLSQWLLLRVV